MLFRRLTKYLNCIFLKHASYSYFQIFTLKTISASDSCVPFQLPLKATANNETTIDAARFIPSSSPTPHS